MGLLKLIQRGLDPLFNPLNCLPQPEEAEICWREDPASLLRRLDFQLRQKLKEGTFGDQKSVVRGHGLDFTHLREYTAGDDIRKIDWNVFARTFTPFVREYQEEKQLTVWLVMDFTPSMFFGSRQTKARTALELAGLLGLLATQQGHRLGAFTFTAGDRSMIQPRSGNLHLQRILKAGAAILQREAVCVTTMSPDRLEQVCGEIARVVSKRSTIFFISDFLAPQPGWQKALGDISRRCDFNFLMCRDPLELSLPADLGILTLFDPETQRVFEFDTSDPSHRSAYQNRVAQADGQLMKELSLLGNPIPVFTDQDAIGLLWSILGQAGTTRVGMNAGEALK